MHVSNLEKIPNEWQYGIINPILKDSSSDKRIPLNYRGIALTSSVYKAYCSFLNKRLNTWAETNNILTDTQNGFRQKRSTIDHLSSLTSIIENRKKLKKSTFVGFVDFKKAYDSIDRSLLWSKLTMMGVKGKLLDSLRSIYEQVKYCVKVNGYKTDWFDVSVGLKQGCLLSPMLFNLFIDDLAKVLEQSGNGVLVDGIKISCLFYADDLILIGDSPEDLQHLFDILSQWSNNNGMNINIDKTKVVHFRTQSVQQTVFPFQCCGQTVSCTDRYKYLGLVLNEFLDLSVTAKFVAQSATRALGLLISKFKSLGGMPMYVYSKLYDTMVWSVIDYGAAIWGTREYACINAVQNRAERFFLGVGKYTPNAAVNGDVGWSPPIIKQWKSVLKQWLRLNSLENSRINRTIFVWDCNSKDKCRNWNYRLYKCFTDHNINEHVPVLGNIYSKQEKYTMLNHLEARTYEKYIHEWLIKLNNNSSARPNNGGNKLRTYCKFKEVYKQEKYVQYQFLSRTHRSALAKFRAGVAPLRIETGRYESIPLPRRVCFNYNDMIEDETHVLLFCPLYDEIRNELFQHAYETEQSFNTLNDIDKLCFLLSRDEMVKFSAKACSDILNTRRNFIYQLN